MTRERATQILSAITHPVTSFPDKVIGWLAKLPSTNARIAVTLGVVVGTAVRYWWSSPPWEPSGEWLAFLVAMSGVDVLQFHSKRQTQKDPPPTAGGEA
jgi:hypothetical protein